MVSLPCRRARKAKDAPTIPEETIPETGAVETPNISAPTSEERQALQSLFQQLNLPDAQTNEVVPTSQKPRGKETPVDERHSRMELLSQRLRNRLSRETRLLKSRSKPSIVQRNQNLAENLPPTFTDSNMLPDILGSGPASEGGYDSDAQNIMTPRVEPSIASSANIPVENANRNNLQDDATIPSQEDGSKKNAHGSENIKEITNPQSCNMDARSEPSISDVRLSSECLASEGFGSPCTSETNETGTPAPRSAIRIPPDNSTILNASYSKVGVTFARTSRASEPAESNENIRLVFPQRSFSLANRQTLAVKQSIGSPLDSVPKPLEDLYFSPDTPNSTDRALTTADQNHRRDASSVYASRPNSLPPSPRSCARGFSSPLPGEIGSIDATTSMNEVTTPVTINGPNLVENNPVSKQKREPSVSGPESQIGPLVDTLLPSNGPGQGLPTKSKFTEQLGPLDTKQRNAEDPQRQNRESSSDSSRRTSDGWLSGGKRKGYGYEFVSETDEDANIMWKRAIKEHAGGESVRARQRSQNSFAWRGRMSSMKSSRNSSEHSIEKQHSAVYVLPEEWTSPGDQDKIPAPGIGIVMSKKEKNKRNNSVRSLRAWTRFPSHSRAERCASADTTDNVTVRDFSSTQDQRPILETGLHSPQVDGQVERETQRKSGMEWIRQWTKLSRQSSVDLRRYRAGHWPGMSRSGHLKYPELELIPDGPRPYVVMEELGNVEKANRKFLRRQKEQTRDESNSNFNGLDVNRTNGPNTGAGPTPEPECNSDSGSASGTENEFFLAPFFPLTPEQKVDSPTAVIEETASMEPSLENISA